MTVVFHYDILIKILWGVIKIMKKTSKSNSIVKKLVTAGVVLATAATISGCNRSIIDTKYGLDTALISGDDTAITCNITDWRDYEGEQYQLLTDEGLLMLTASFDTDLFYGDSDTYSVDNFAKNSVSPNGEVYDYSKPKAGKIFNYDLLDTRWRFNKSVTFNGNKALVLNIAKWRDYEGEQLQVVTDENVVLLLSSYNSKLFYDKQSTMKAEEFASMYVGTDGTVSELGSDIDDTIFNYDLIDLNYNFNKIIIFKDEKAVILPIDEWTDYEGEQLQVKVTNGPILVTAAYDSILLNDTRSNTKAIDIASKMSDDVVDYSKGLPEKEGFFNKTILDFVYGFNNAIISNNNSSSVVSINKWCDYEGEQLQVVLPNGDTILTSSIFLDMLNGGSETINAKTIAENYAQNKIINNGSDFTSSIGFNRQLLDYQLQFNYALHVENGNVTVLPLARWKDYYNSNGKKSEHKTTNPDGTRHKVVTEDEEPSPNCEQLQLELPDGTVLLTSAYDTILIKTTHEIMDYAEMFRGEDGVITNLTDTFGEPTADGWNFILIDTKWNFNYAIYNNGVNSQIFKVATWLDYADGEQVQLKFLDGRGILTSYPTTTLVCSEDSEKVEIIGKAFAGEELGKGKVFKLGIDN